MALKKIFIITIILLLLSSFALSADIVPINNNDLAQQNSQQFAQLTAKILDLSNQVTALKTSMESAQAEAFKKSDLQNLYDNIVNIQKQGNTDLLTSMIIAIIASFCVFFILIGKNLLPTHTKEERMLKEKENKALVKENEKLKKALEGKSIALKSIAEKVNNPKEKKGWFSKKTPPLNPSSPPKVTYQNLPVNPHIEELKREFGEPVPKWREEIIKSEARVELLKELQKNGGLNESMDKTQN